MHTNNEFDHFSWRIKSIISMNNGYNTIIYILILDTSMFLVIFRRFGFIENSTLQARMYRVTNSLLSFKIFIRTGIYSFLSYRQPNWHVCRMFNISFFNIGYNLLNHFTLISSNRWRHIFFNWFEKWQLEKCVGYFCYVKSLYYNTQYGTQSENCSILYVFSWALINY